MLIPAIVLITAALIFYTWGVWAERRQGTLRGWHVALFALGFAADASGTFIMSRIAAEGTYEPTGVAAILSQLMAVTGMIALILMGLHLAWALWVHLRGSQESKATFHRYSLVVWAIWLVPYVTGAASAMIN